MLKRIGNYLGLLIVTVAAVAVMALVSTGWRSSADDAEQDAPLTETPVAIAQIDEESIEIVQTYSGRIKPLEEYSLAFEITGRLAEFGLDDNGETLDDGMRVRRGQTLAKLDDTLLSARLAEAKALQAEAKAALDQAEASLRRSDQLRADDSGLISPEDYDASVARRREAAARLQVADAHIKQAQTNFDYATLLSPVDGVIAKRHSNVGESIAPQNGIFHIVQVDRVLLIVGVPASQVRNIQVGATASLSLNDRDPFGRPRDDVVGTVRRVAETADDMTRLFEVEIVLDNRDSKLKPGLIATARIVTDTVRGFRLPLTSVIFRGKRDQQTGTERETGHIFSVAPSAGADGADVQTVAQQFVLDRWIEQDLSVIVMDLPEEHRQLVIRGHHRLLPGRPVKIVDANGIASTAD